MHFFLLLFVKMYCIFYVLLVRKINLFVFLLQMSFAAFLEVGKDQPGRGEQAPQGREGAERKGGDGHVSSEQQRLPGSRGPLPRVISSRLSWLRSPFLWVLAVFCCP